MCVGTSRLLVLDGNIRKQLNFLWSFRQFTQKKEQKELGEIWKTKSVESLQCVRFRKIHTKRISVSVFRAFSETNQHFDWGKKHDEIIGVNI